MNSLVVLIICGFLFWVAYKFYARKIENLWEISDNPTPAFTKFDGVDYVPAKNWLVLFGHHFASIAGAGPIIGPVIALTLWGWLPALIWVVVGTIFIGGVHDFGNLITSVKEGGSSIADIASEAISKKARMIFSLFVWLALILVIAVFAYLCADTFIQEPKIIIPSLGLIPVAMLVGFMLYNLKINASLSTIIGMVLLVGLIIFGQMFPLKITNSQATWTVILLVYAFFASIIPVNILLQPRDYLSSFLLFFGLLFGFLGLFTLRPAIRTQAFIHYHSSSGDLWPMMCVIVACGAISGFHSLVASGTSSKQLPTERSARKISYGGMLAEGLLAVMVILAVAAGLNSKELSSLAADKASPIGIYSLGYGNITQKVLGGSGALIGVLILNAFILTTLDTATRITRYLTEEMTKIKNRLFSTFIVVVLAGYLALSKDKFSTPLWKKMWPAFGVSNQLVGALALLVLSCWLLRRKKPARYTFLPAMFMLVTTIVALIYQASIYFRNRDYVLLIISILLFGLALFMIKEVSLVFRRLKSNV